MAMLVLLVETRSINSLDVSPVLCQRIKLIDAVPG